LLNEDTVPYTVHIGTSSQITPNFAKNFVIYLYRFPKLQPRPRVPQTPFIAFGGAEKERKYPQRKPAVEPGLNREFLLLSKCQTFGKQNEKKIHPRGIIICYKETTVELNVGTVKYFRDIEPANIELATLLNR
jgi:hypothetical protein